MSELSKLLKKTIGHRTYKIIRKVFKEKVFRKAVQVRGSTNNQNLHVKIMHVPIK